MAENIHIDFETRSFADIKDVGSFRYSEDPTTEILCMGYAIGDRPPQVWIPAYGTPPLDVFNALNSGLNIHAWNAEFEMNIWENICVKQLGWPSVPLDMWRDTMAQAAAQSLPLALGKASMVFGSEIKMADGARLITKLCRPYKGRFREYQDFQKDFLDLYDYCKQDVVVERFLSQKLKPLTPKELKIWQHCIMMNRRGIPVDISELRAVLDKVEKQKERLNAKLPWLTKGEIVSAMQVEKLKKYILREFSIDVGSLDAVNVANIVKDENLPDKMRRIVAIRQEVSRSSTAKLSKATKQICRDGTIKNNLVYYGANTGRYAGRGFQLQNLPRGKKIENPDTVIRDFMIMEPSVLNLTYDVMDTAKSLIRPLIKAPHGKKFIVGDFTSIEAWVTPWIANEKEVLASINKGLDLYREIASRMFKVNYKKVSDDQRQAGKICVLAAGFSGGARALLVMAEAYGLSMTEHTAQRYIDSFRTARPELVNCWHLFDNAAKSAINMNAPVVAIPDLGCKIFFRKEGTDLIMKLPSGRDIYYPNARLDIVKSAWGRQYESVVYDTVNSTTHKWDARAMSGGNFFQNAVQGVARDLLTNAQLNLEIEGYPIIISVHDECGAMVDDDTKYSLGKFLEIMQRKPGWAFDLPVKADGWEGYRYRK